MSIDIPFNRELNFEYGVCEHIAKDVRRIMAPNPSAFTFHGTGTYIIGSGSVAVIDPGPNIPGHVEAILNALSGESISHILVTHTHLDHSPAVKLVKDATGAPSYAFGAHGRNLQSDTVEEGADFDFTPDHFVNDGQIISGEGWTVQGVHTPGHTSNHMCFSFQEENALFCGDHVMGWSTTVVSPPDGNMKSYMASLKKVAGRKESIFYPTHGAPILDPKSFIFALIAHREEREEQIIQCLKDGVSLIPEMVKRIYVDIDPKLHKAAGQSGLAHIIHLGETNRAKCSGHPTIEKSYDFCS